MELSELLSYGCLLIKGIKADDKGVRLYVANVIDLKKREKKDGAIIYTAILEKQPYIVVKEKDKLTVKSVNANYNTWVKALGITNYSVVLNKNKCPLWFESIQYSIPTFIKKFEKDILSIPDVHIPIF